MFLNAPPSFWLIVPVFFSVSLWTSHLPCAVSQTDGAFMKPQVVREFAGWFTRQSKQQTQWLWWTRIPVRAGWAGPKFIWGLEFNCLLFRSSEKQTVKKKYIYINVFLQQNDYNLWRELELSWREGQHLQMLIAPDANLSYKIWPGHPFKLLLRKQYRVYNTV